MTQIELKERLKVAMRRAGLDYNWLSEKLGITRCTLNNYMARKPIPDGQLPHMIDIMQKLEAGQMEVVSAPPVKKKRHRRTNEQIRLDIEESKRLGQERMAIEGYDDSETIDRKWREFGKEALENYKTQYTNAITDYQISNVLDMSSNIPDQVNVSADSIVYRLAIPVDIVAIYEKEVQKIKNMNLGAEYDNVTVPMLLARAITEDARALSDCWRPFFMDKLQEHLDRWKKLNEQTETNN